MKRLALVCVILALLALPNLAIGQPTGPFRFPQQVILDGGTTNGFGASSIEVNGPADLNGTTTVPTAATLTINGTVNGTNAPITTTSTGLTFTGSNTYSGTTTITGTLSMGSNTPLMNATGSNANVGLSFQNKGGAQMNFNNGSGAPMFAMTGAASGQSDYILCSGGNLTDLPICNTAGPDTAIGIQWGSKGGGTLFFASTYSVAPTFENVLQLIPTNQNAVNYLSINDAVTGSAPAINAVGSDANIDLVLNAKGSSSVKASEIFGGANHPVRMEMGTAALSAGSASVTYTHVFSVTPIVQCNDGSAANAVKCSSSTSTLTITGTGTDTIQWLAVGY